MRIAAIDIGTNSIHMVIAQSTRGAGFEVVEREREVVQIGSGSFDGGRLKRDAIRRTADALSRFVQLAPRMQTDRILCTATAAVRESRNGGEFLRVARQISGVTPRVIPGEEEGRLIYLAVRRALLARQRAFRRAPGLVADGRDIGTVVFPDAALKIFLTADPDVRAERRYKQLIEKGISANLRALSRDLAERDARDANRPVAPLVPAADSQVLDSSALSIDEVVERIVGWWRDGSNMGGHR